MEKNTVQEVLLSGGVAGVIARTSTAPLDRLKVLFQLGDAQGLGQTLKHIYEQGGVRGYFVGNGINVLKVAPEFALKFCTYELLKGVVAAGEEQKGKLGAVEKLACGGLAGAFAQTVIYPMDVLKTRLQVQDGKTVAGLASTARNILAKEGPGALYRGLAPTLMGIVPYASIDLAMYETLKDGLFDGSEITPVQQMVCGSLSGASGAIVAYPLQVVRTKLQADSAKYSGMTDVLKTTFQRQGVVGFYRGLLPTLLKVAPSASITYLVYEHMKKFSRGTEDTTPEKLQ